MDFNRRFFLAGGLASSATEPLGCGQEQPAALASGDLSSARRGFPRGANAPKIEGSPRFGNTMRVSGSAINNQDDVEAVVAAFA